MIGGRYNAGVQGAPIPTAGIPMIDPLKPSARGGPLSPRPSPFEILAVRTPVARIVLLVVLLLLVIGGMVGLNQWAKQPEAKQISPDVPVSIEVPHEAPTGIPPLDMSIAERLTDNGPEARKRWPTEAIHYLLLVAANTPAVFSYDKNLLPITPGSAKEIEKDSRPWRFKFVRFRGEIEYLEQVPDESSDGAGSKDLVWRGRVRCDKGDPPLRVVFVTVTAPMWADTNENTPRPETKLIEKGWIRGRGIFVQNYTDERGGDVPALLVVATGIERDYEAVPVHSLKDVPFDIIQDNPTIAATDDGRAILMKEYPTPLFRLVAYAEPRAGAPGASKRAEEGLKAERLATQKSWEQLVGMPNASRGKYFGGLGVIIDSPMHYGPETITPNDAGVDECSNGWILTDEHKLLQYVAPAEVDELPKGTRVHWEGFFYKTKLYPARDGSERLAPMFVATVVEKVVPAQVNHLFPVIVAGSIVLGMMFLAFLVLREDRTKANYRRIRQQKIAADHAPE
jgi:hypothetical protein